VAHGDFIFPAMFSFLEIAGNAGSTLHTYQIGISTQNAISFRSFMARISSFAVHDKEISSVPVDRSEGSHISVFA
jgi:hypothetical protein